MKRVRFGFTIVELVIVVSAIVILAAIVVVGYGNMQQKANTSTTINILKQYINAIELYKYRTGAYPDGNSCLGGATDYPSAGGMGSGVCQLNPLGGGSAVSLQESFMNDLRGKIGADQVLNINSKVIYAGSSGQGAGRGIRYSKPADAPYVIHYVISNLAKCPSLDRQVDAVGNQQCAYYPADSTKSSAGKMPTL